LPERDAPGSAKKHNGCTRSAEVLSVAARRNILEHGRLLPQISVTEGLSASSG
jgi:hypothetical protein